MAKQAESGLMRCGTFLQRRQRRKQNTRGVAVSENTGCGKVEWYFSITSFFVRSLRCGMLLSRYRLPLAEDLPELLPTRRMRTPAIGILLDVFIGQNRLKGPAMQIQIQHIFGGKSRSGKSGDKQFVDHAITLFPDGGARGCGGMTSDDQSDSRSSCREGDVRAIIKGTGGSTFRMGADLDGRTRQNRLDRGQIQQRIVTTASDETQSGVQNLAFRTAALPYNPDIWTTIWERRSWCAAA